MEEDIAFQLFQIVETRMSALQTQVWAIQAQLVGGAVIAAAFLGRRAINGHLSRKKPGSGRRG